LDSPKMRRIYWLLEERGLLFILLGSWLFGWLDSWFVD
jgi:hypothetical protein